MRKLHLSIASDYATYNTIVNERKNTQEKIIGISKDSQKHSRKDTFFTEVELAQTFIQHGILLTIEGKKTNQASFKFQIKCPAYYPVPLFRFDSDGATHRNFNSESKLRDIQITTPHFNIIKADGREYAYKIEQDLSDLDISSTFKHFCNECNTRFDQDDYSEIFVEPQGELFGSSDDLLADVNFGI